jgi:FMN phosphatase YigB (HAD superfamily)
MNTPRLAGVEACVFDAYGTLFDVNSAARTAQNSLGERWQPLAELWRAKQLQYTWLRSHRFLASDGRCPRLRDVEDSALRSRLMNLYLVLSVSGSS